MSIFGLHYRLERKTIGLVLGIIVVASIGGLGRDRAAVHHPSDRRGRAGHAASTRRSRSPAATSTSAKAATPAIRR